MNIKIFKPIAIIFQRLTFLLFVFGVTSPYIPKVVKLSEYDAKIEFNYT